METLPQNVEDLVALIEATEQEPLDKRLCAVTALGDLLLHEPDPKGILCLLEQVKTNHSARLVMHCISVLSRVKAYSAVAVILDVVQVAQEIRLFQDPAYVATEDCLRLRCVAAQALGRMGDSQAIDPLMRLLNNRTENYRLRLAAAESLGRLGDHHAVSPLLDILVDDREKSLYLKESAAKALGMLGDIRAIEPLIDLLESKRGIRDKFNFLKEQIIEALARIGRPHQKATDSLLYALKDEAPSIRLAAVEALGVIGEPHCIGHLKTMLADKDDDVALAAVSAIYTLGGEPAVREMLALETLPQFVRDELESYVP